MQIKRSIIFLFLAFYVGINAQEREITISGKIIDKETQEAIPFVHIVINDGNDEVETDVNGEFEIITGWSKKVDLQLFHTAYRDTSILVEEPHLSGIIIYLEPKLYQTKEVTVRGADQSILKGNIPGKLKLKQSDIFKPPTVLGEPDLIRTLQLLPGIQSVNEGNSGIYVRGGSPGQNYIVLDDIELLNPSHLMGIYSVFNPLLIENVDFFKGNAPIHQSTRIASSIIVESVSKANGQYNWSGNVGNITSNLCYQGRSKNNKWNTIIGYRRSYLEIIQLAANQLISDKNNYFTNNQFNFYDLNGKINYKNGANDLTLAWYKGRDFFNFSHPKRDIKMNNNWGNYGASLVWKMLFSSDFSTKNVFSYSGYKSSLNIAFLDQDLNLESAYEQYQFKNEYLYQRRRNLYRFGIHAAYRIISPQDIDLSLNTATGGSSSKYKHLALKIFASDNIQVTEKLNVYLGAANEYYRHAKKFNKSINNDFEFDNSVNKDQFLWNTVFTFNYQLPSNSALKGSYSYVSQNIHLTSIASMPLPSDIWMPATQKVPVEAGHQFTLGCFKEYDSNNMELGLEAYGKLLENQILLNVNVSGEEVVDFEDNFFKGKGKSYGAEVLLKKKGEKINANLSYTIGWVKQKFDAINNGKWYDAKYDRRHDLNILLSYKLNKKIDVVGVFIFASGNKATLPVGRYWLMGSIANDYEGVNNYRMPVYHRLDLSVNYRLNSRAFKESMLNFSLVNVLNRSNPYFIYYQIKEGNRHYDIDIKARQVSLFPILPSLSWKFKF